MINLINATKFNSEEKEAHSIRKERLNKMAETSGVRDECERAIFHDFVNFISSEIDSYDKESDRQDEQQGFISLSDALEAL